jgi:hypothetical protein
LEAEPSQSSVPSSVVPSYRDRSTGLVIFGIIQIIFACFAALTLAIMTVVTLDALASTSDHVESGQFPAMLIYALLCVSFFILGVGSIRKRRWARALTLVGSCYGLFLRFLATVLITALFPIFMRAQPEIGRSTSPSTGILAFAVTSIIVCCAFFLIFVPLGFVALYSQRRRTNVSRSRSRGAMD